MSPAKAVKPAATDSSAWSEPPARTWEAWLASDEMKPFSPNGTFIQWWDYLILLLLSFTATVTPFEVSYLGSGLDDPTHRRVILFAVNRLVDFLFMVDMGIQLNLQYQEPMNKGGRWVSNRRNIAVRYFSTWFPIDLISIFQFDVVGDESNSSGVTDLKILRVVRLLRLVKLLRMFRLQRVLDRIQDRYNLNSSMVTLVKFIVGVMVLCHWFACSFHAVSRFQDVRPNEVNWVDKYFATLTSWRAALRPGVEPYVDEYQLSPYDVYIASLYYSMVSLCTIGYGDIVPTTSTERFYVIFELLFGTSIFAYVIGVVVGTISNLDAKNAIASKVMNDLNVFMDEAGLREDLRSELRAYFRHRSRAFEGRKLLEQMSPEMRANVAEHQFGDWIRMTAVFKHAPRGLVLDVAQIMVSTSYPKKEILVGLGDDLVRLFIVEKGIVGAKGRVYTSGKMLGEELLTGMETSSFIARALVMTDVFVLFAGDILDVIDRYPDVKVELYEASYRRKCADSLLSFVSKWNELTSLFPSPAAKAAPVDTNQSAGQEANAQRQLARDLDANNFVATLLEATRQQTGTLYPVRPAIETYMSEGTTDAG